MMRFIALFLLAVGPIRIACAQPLPVVSPGQPVASGPINAGFNARVQHFSGSGAPGTVTGSTRGDEYLDTASFNVYDCWANPGPCTAVATNNWTLRANGGGGGGGGSVFTGSTAVTSSFSATPTFSLADVSVKSPIRFEPGALTANVTAVTFSNKSAGAHFYIAWTQDGTGGRTVAYGASASNTCTIDPKASSITTQEFIVAADGVTVIGLGCPTNSGVAIGNATEIAQPATPPSGLATCWFDSTDHTWHCMDNASSTVFTLVTAAACSTNNFIKAISAAGVLSCDLPNPGGGSAIASPSLWPFGQMAYNPGAVQAQAIGAANRVQYYPVFIPAPGIVLNYIQTYWFVATGHVAMAIYDSTCTKVTNGNSTTLNAPTTSAGVRFVFSTPPTLTYGKYYVGITSDQSADQLYGTDSGFFGDIANAGGGTPERFYGANASSGGTTQTLPSTCGARTGTVGGTDAAPPLFLN
jgi:hypothetical protein